MNSSMIIALVAPVLTRPTIDGGVTGDVNGDGEVNIGDLNAAITMILSNSSEAAGDVNGDGEVNIGDVNAIIGIILSAN